MSGTQQIPTQQASDPSIAYRLANTNEAALAARTLNVQTAFLAQVLVDTGIVTVTSRMVKKEAARLIRRRAAVIGPNDPISTELEELADHLEES